MPKVWPSSTLTTPSLPTLSIASAMTLPISSSAAEMAATRAICSLPAISFDCFSRRFSTTWSTACSMPRRSASGLAPAATFLRPVADDRLRQQRRRRGAVAGDVVGRRGDLADQLGALVLEHVLDLDLAGDGDAVVGDRRGAELLVEHDVTALGAEGHLDRVGHRVDAALQRAARLLVVLQLLVSHLFPFLLVLLSSKSGSYSTLASTSDSRRTSSSSPSTVISVPPYLL